MEERLSKKQKQVMIDICNGGCLITDSEMKGAVVAFDRTSNKKDYHINNGVFFRLYNKGLIFQDMKRHFGYYPTQECLEKYKR